MKASIKVASDGVEVARSAYEAGHRTWLRVYPTEVGPVTFKSDRIQVDAIIETENIGEFPAIAVHLGCKPYRGRVSTSAIANLITEEKALSSSRSGMSGIVLRRGQKHSCEFISNAEIDAVSEAKAKEQESLGVPAVNLQTTLSIVFCVIYKSMASDDWLHTGHIIWLRKKDGSKFDAALGDVTTDNISAPVFPGESSLA